ncbi:hypothetical protein AWENTII_005014 [Aspergillus wentii]|nr:hypothetical protein MW887_008915 [Aspergillus wentii]
MDSSGSQEKKSIPRFASFKPPPAPPPQADRPPERRSREIAHRDERSSQRSRHRSHRDRSRSRERRKGRREYRHSHRRDVRLSREITPEPLPVPKAAVRELKDAASDLYVVDLKGDRHNLFYGTLHRYSVPKYHRVGRGNVLGLPRSYKIDRDTAEGDALVLRKDAWRTDATRSKAKSVLSGLGKQKTKLLRVRQQSTSDAAVEASRDFLPFPTSARQKFRANLGEYDSDNEKHGYRSIHGKAKPEDDLPSDLEVVSDTDSEDEAHRVDPDEEIRKLNAELSRNAERNPSDIDAWLRLIDHQDSLLRGAGKESRSLTYAERKSLADIKVSLYEKTLKRAGQSPAKDRLLIGLLEEGAKLWDTKKLSAQWQAVLKSNSQFVSLWVRYLDFRQTEFLDFTYERCMATFIDCLRLNRSSPEGAEKVQVHNYLFLRLTLFIRESGFSEHAVGLWQAILEWTFFQPEFDLSNDQNKALSAFIEFWESEVARIGEVGAKGWKSGSSSSIEPREFTAVNRINLKSIFASWVTCERERVLNARVPARSLDESDDNDPYRVVISSDLQDYLSLFWGFDSGDVLIDSFLYFCHLPPLTSPENAETTSRWAGDAFLSNDLMGNPDAALDDWLPNMDSRSEETSALSPTSFPLQNYIHTLDTYFADSQSWFSSFKPWIKATLHGRSEIDNDWVRRTLRLLVEANPANEDLAEYTLAVEFACNGKEARKYAKSLLKKRSTSLRLYNSYALIERRSGNHTAADHVWATSLSMSQTFADRDRTGSGLLWRTWIWEALETRDMARACRLLISIPQHSVDLKSFPEASTQTAFSPTNLLKIRSFLTEAQENTLATRKPKVFVAYTDCLALVSYLSNSLDLNKALDTYATAISRLSSLPVNAQSFKPFTLELLHQARSKLIYYHIQTSGVYKPYHIRTLLAESISLFPHNTIFLSLFAWNESRFRIEERVRDVIRDITTQTPSRNDHQKVPVTSHLFSIYTELTRPVYAGSTLHSVRAAFEKAIGSPTPSSSSSTQASRTTNDNSTAHSNLSLWKLYILFELSRNDIQRAKDVFYRGMRACPWSKELIMLAFTHLRADIVRDRYGGDVPRKGDGMGFDELRRVYNVLVEKELRVHVDIENELDEMVANMQVTTTSSGIPIHMPDDAESEDEKMR